MKTKYTGRDLNLETREGMFDLYLETRSVQAVANEYGISTKSVRRYKRVDKWDERVEYIESRIRARTNERAVNRRLRNVKVLDLAIEDIKKTILEAQANGITGVVDPKLLSKLVLAQDVLIGRGAADEEQPDLSPEAKEALEFLQSLGPKALVQLADYISRQLAQQAQSPSGSPYSQPLLPDTSSGQMEISKQYEPVKKRVYKTKKKKHK